MVAVDGVTITLLIALPVPVGACVTLTLSPQAAATIAVAATNSDERRTLMYDPPRSEEQLYNPAKYADDRTDQQPSLKKGPRSANQSPHIPLVPFGRCTSAKSYQSTTEPSRNLPDPVQKVLYKPRTYRVTDESSIRGVTLRQNSGR